MYPKDQTELKNFLIANPDTAIQWFDEECFSYVQFKFNTFRVGMITKLRQDFDQLVQDCRISWWMTILPSYDSTKLGTLGGWSRYCLCRFIITFFRSNQHGDKKFYNSCLSMDEITNTTPEGHELHIFMDAGYEKQIDDEKTINICNSIMDDLENKLVPILTEKELRIFRTIIDIYQENPEYIQKIRTAPMTYIAKRLRVSPKTIDNGMQRIRNKLNKLGMR